VIGVVVVEEASGFDVTTASRWKGFGRKKGLDWLLVVALRETTGMCGAQRQTGAVQTNWC
jgi:hypothetical protein